MRLRGLRLRLAAVAVVPVLVAIALVTWQSFGEHERIVDGIESDAVRLAQVAAADLNRTVGEARQVLVTVGRLAPGLDAEGEGCAPALRDLLADLPSLLDLGVVRTDGRVVCRAGAGPSRAPAGAAWLARARAGGGLALGAVERRTVPGTPTVVVALPLDAAAGRPPLVAFAALRLEQLARLPAARPLPPDAVFIVVDREGRILARNLDHDRWVGRRLPEVPLIDTIVTRREGAAEVRGVDGVSRLYAFTTLPLGTQAVVHPAIGLLTQEALAPARRQQRVTLALLAIAAALALLAAAALGDVLVRRPIQALVAAARRIREGDLGARVGALRGGDEVAGLGRDFDEMADALQRRAAEAERAELERRALLADLFQAEQNERDRIAADLHDDALQAMSAVRLRLGLVERQVAGEEGRSALAALAESVRQASRRLRRLLFEIHPPALDEAGLGPALEAYLAQASDGWGLTGHEVVDRLPADAPAEVRAALYRVALQALANVRQHAGASRVEVRVEPRGGGVALTVRDDGSGFDAATAPARPGHIGVPFMRERVALLGGRFSITSAPGEGTTVEAWIPLDGAPAG